MLIICAWCKKFLGYKAPYANSSTSHALCADCAEKMRVDITNYQSAFDRYCEIANDE